LSQDPSSGEYPEGTTITLVVSNGSEDSFTLPDLTGMSVDDAEDALEDEDWDGDLEVSEQLHPDEDESGNIIRQEPQAGSTVDEDETIEVIVAKHPSDDDDEDGGIFDG